MNRSPRFVPCGAPVLFGVAIVAAWMPVGAQVAAIQPAAPPAGTALVVGQLVEAGTGAPVSGAVVSLRAAAVPGAARGVALPPAPDVITDGRGRFVLGQIPAGTFTLAASRRGYLPTQFGQTQPPPGGGRPLTLSAGQRMTNVTLTIWRQGSVAGVVVDEAGEPLVGWRVNVLRRFGGGDATSYMSQGAEQTDDRGMYQIDLPQPGDYVVVVPTSVNSVPLAVVDAYLDVQNVPPTQNPVSMPIFASGGSISAQGTRLGDVLVTGEQTGAGVASPGSVYPTTFAPGTPTIVSARVVSVGAGEDVTGVDITVRPVPAATVTGRVMGPGGPVAHVAVKFTGAGVQGLTLTPSAEFESASAITRSDGTFTAVGVPTGDHRVSVTVVPRAQPLSQPVSTFTVTLPGGGTQSVSSSGPPGRAGSTRPAPPTEPVLWGRVNITVEPDGATGVALHLVPGAAVSGRVEFEPGTATPPTEAQLASARVSLRPMTAGGPMRPGTIAADGTFTTPGDLPGRYQLLVSLSAPGWVLRSAMSGGTNLLDTGVDLGGDDLRGVTLIFTDQAGEISGSVVAAGSLADAPATAVLVPAQVDTLARNGMLLQRMRALPIRGGSFRLTGVVPGDYILVALPIASTANLTDRDLLAAVARNGTRVTLGNREQRTVSLRIAPERRP